MILLQASNVARHFGAEILFDQVNLEVKSGARIGLVGRNGAGKSTLLHILAGIEEPDEGRISKRKDLTVGFLDQHTGLESERTIMEEMLAVFEPVIELEKNMRRTEERISQLDPASEEYQDVMTQYDNMQVRFRQLGGYSYQSDIRMVLHGFRFYEEDFDKPINTLSGGQKTRLALAKLLLEKKDLLILDEPTNHLDIDTLSWLESFLKNYPGALLIVSHDRYFLDHVITEVYEVSMQNVQHFPGNYSTYLDLKAEQIQRQWKEYEKQQKKISEMEDFIQKNLVRASTTKRAQSRRKKLQKMDKIEKPEEDNQSASFSFQTERSSGDIVLQTDNLAIGYPAAPPLASHIDLDIRKGDRIALVGPNGIGKTTLLKTLTDQLAPLAGHISHGTKVDMGYYDQEQLHLNHQKSILMELWDDHPHVDEVTIRTLLGNFLFSGEDVEKRIGTLSGGERARVALAKLAIEQNNCLILDEPTNHLDIDSKEVLENALSDFDGTLLFVSHDRYFINRIANKVYEINPDGITVYLGDYDYYLQKKEELEALANLDQDQPETSSNEPSSVTSATLDRQALKERQSKHRKLTRRSDEIENQLTEIEEAIARLADELSEPDIYQEPERLQELTDRTQALEAQQLELMEEWEELQETLETLAVD